MEDMLNVSLGDATRELVITNATTKRITMPDGTESHKVIFHANEKGSSIKFDISDSYVDRPNGKVEIKGIWLSVANGKITSGSTLAKVLRFNGVESVKDMVGKTVKAYPDPDDYLVLVTCPTTLLPTT